MSRPLNAKIAGIVLACVTSAVPVSTFAQGSETTPSGSFSFGNFGSTQVDDLPLEISNESVRPAPQFPTTVIELGTTPVLADVQPTRVQPRRIQNTWAIGVFR